MTARCKHIACDNLRGTECELTGAGVGSDCGAPADRALDDAGECIPRQAARYLCGDREAFALLTRADRELVMVTAATIGKRIKEGLLLSLKQRRREAMPKEENSLTDLSEMSAEQLLALADRARTAARERAEAQVARIKPALEAEIMRLKTRVALLCDAVVDLEDGKAVNLRDLGVKIGTLPGLRREWTPERRLFAALAVLERNAQRYHWSPKRLAEARKKEREKRRGDVVVQGERKEKRT